MSITEPCDCLACRCECATSIDRGVWPCRYCKRTDWIVASILTAIFLAIGGAMWLLWTAVR